MSRVIVTLAILSLAHVAGQKASAEAYGSGWYSEIQFTVGHEDNVARSYKSVDVTDDLISSASVGIGYSGKVGSNIQYVVGGYLSQSIHQEYDNLDHTAISLNGSLVWQPSPSFDAIWYRLTAEATRLSYPHSRAREGYLLTAGTSVNKRLGMRTIGHLGYRYHDLVFDKNDAEANQDAAFDIARHEIFAGIDYRLTGKIWLAAQYAFQHGGFTSSSSLSSDAIDYDAETEDHAFEACGLIQCTAFYAYRSVTDLHAIDLAIVAPLLGADVELSGRYFDASSENGTDYSDWVLQLGVIWTL